jgi:hypothetical protein
MAGIGISSTRRKRKMSNKITVAMTLGYEFARLMIFWYFDSAKMKCTSITNLWVELVVILGSGGFYCFFKS